MNYKSLLSAATISLSIFMLCACEPQVSAVTKVSDARSNHIIPGRIDGAHFYPEFQRWRVVRAALVGKAASNQQATDLHVLFGNKLINFSSGYFTVPFTVVDDRLSIACFKHLDDKVVAQIISHRTNTAQLSLELRAATEARVIAVVNKMLELTLEKSDLPPDQGYEEQKLNRYFNLQLRPALLATKATCSLQAITLPPLVHHDIAFVTANSDQKIVAPAAALDPKTILHFDGMSYPWVRDLNPQATKNTVVGCVGETLTVRFGSAGDGTALSKSFDYVVGNLIGKLQNGEYCERTTFLHRIDTDNILRLLKLPPSQLINGHARTPSLDFVEWLDDGTFSGKLGDLPIELEQVGSKEITVRFKGVNPTY
jgi:hypothetical protein